MLPKLARTMAVCLGVWTLGAATAQAGANVYFSNDSHELLCLAVGSNPDSAAGTALMVTGWTCINQGGTLTLPLDDGPKYVMIKDASGADYVARSPDRFRAEQGYAPAAASIIFGLEIVAEFQGTFTYRYYVNGDAWCVTAPVATFEELEAELFNVGFAKYDAWKFSTSDFPGGVGIRLGEFG